MVHGAGEYLEHSFQSLWGGDTETIDETAFNPAFGKVPGHLLAAAVDHNQLDAAGSSGRDLRREPVAGLRRIQEGAAEFDQEFQSRPSVSG